MKKEKRDPKKFIPFSPNELITGIIEEDVPNEELNSEFSEYELSTGIILNIRSMVSQIKKTKYYTQDGEPVYIVDVMPVVKVKINK